MLFDIENLFKKVKLTERQKAELIQEVRLEFPNDEMMFELHLMRAVHHLEKGKLVDAKTAP